MIVLMTHLILMVILAFFTNIPDWGIVTLSMGGFTIIVGSNFYWTVIKREIEHEIFYIIEKVLTKSHYKLHCENRREYLFVEEHQYKRINEGETIGIIYRGNTALIIVKSNGSVIRTKWHKFLLNKDEKYVKTACVELLKALRVSSKK